MIAFLAIAGWLVFIFNAAKAALGVSSAKDAGETVGKAARDFIDTVRPPPRDGPPQPLSAKDVQHQQAQMRSASRPESAFPATSFPVTSVPSSVRTLPPKAALPLSAPPARTAEPPFLAPPRPPPRKR